MTTEKPKERVSKAGGVTYFLHVPEVTAPPAGIFVTVHGWSRNAFEHAEKFLPFAASRGVILVAPLFDRRRFPWYQRLGTRGTQGRADLALDEIVAEVGRLADVPTTPLHMFGHSGGGQFVHRYVMAYPERVRRAALGAPGWYTFPDPGLKYPWGIGPDKRLPDLQLEPQRFLEVPMEVLVGEMDTARDRNLNKSLTVDRAQGLDRRERGKRWVEAMNAAARACSLDTEYRRIVMPGVGHSFARCMDEGKMGRAVFAFLFGRPGPRRRPG